MMQLTNKNCRVVYSPYFWPIVWRRSRVLISPNKLEFYIGKNNASVCAKRFSECMTDKCTLRFRKYGKIEIYNK